MEEWLANNAWAVWLIASLGLLGAELLTLDLVLLMLAVGAGSAAVVAALGAGAVASLATAVIVSVGMLAVVRPSLARRLHHGPELTTGHQALVGRTAVVLEPVDQHAGQVRLSGEVWSARAYDPTLVMATGTEVHVMEIDGATALVYPTD
jgi:membrane protein implicated in regulation of membrane protease activity